MTHRLLTELSAPGSGSIQPALSATPSTATVAGRLIPAAYATPSDCATVVTELMSSLHGMPIHTRAVKEGFRSGTESGSSDPSRLTVSQRSGNFIHQHSERAQSVIRAGAIAHCDIPRIARRTCNLETDALECRACPARMKWRRHEYQSLPSLSPSERGHQNRLVARTRDWTRKNHLRRTGKREETVLIGRGADPSCRCLPQLSGKHHARCQTSLPELEPFQQTIHCLLRKHSIRCDTR